MTQEEFLPYRKEAGDVQGSGTTRRMSYEEEMVLRGQTVWKSACLLECVLFVLWRIALTLIQHQF